MRDEAPGAGGLLEVGAAFLRLGCTSFGGPIAHLGYLRAEFVEKRRWLDDAHYGDLVALCQFLPGPASSQLVFALGMRRAGLVGALVASAFFTLPSALLMLGFASGLAAVSVTAWPEARDRRRRRAGGVGLCTDRARLSLCLGAAAVLLVVPGALTQLGVIGLGALVSSRPERRPAWCPPSASASTRAAPSSAARH